MLSFFPLDVLDEIWDVIGSVSEGFLTYSSELFPETCQYNVFRKDRNLHGGGVMLIIHKDIPHMPLSELENDSESVWAKIFANKTSHYLASWYRQLI